MNTILEVLMLRDRLSREKAIERIEEAKALLQQYIDEGNIEDAENICEEEFGLEPDYIMELL